MSSPRWLFFNRSTTTRIALYGGLSQQRPYQRRGRPQADSGFLHFREQGLTFAVDEIDFLQIDGRCSGMQCRSRRLPALPQFPNPGAAEPAFQDEEQAGLIIVKRDLQHPTG
jgi:hypothetical protein